MPSKNEVSSGHGVSLRQLCACPCIVPNPQGVISAARNDFVSCSVQFHSSNCVRMASELLKDGARIEIVLNLGEDSIELPDEEAILVRWRLGKSVNVVNGIVGSESDLFFGLLAEVISFCKFFVSDNLLNLGWESFVEEDSLLSFD
jgi:hypothetical protein